MSTICGGPACVRQTVAVQKKNNKKTNTQLALLLLLPRVRACHSLNNNHSIYKQQLGFFPLKKKIEDVVLRAEMLACTSLEIEEARRIKQEEMVHSSNLWDDPAKSSEILVKLGDSTKVVDALKDLQYKAEEAKLIIQLAKMDDINNMLFKQAYDASLDASKFLDWYEMSKLLKGPFVLDGACVIVKAGPQGISSKLWAEQLLIMYSKWAKKQGYRSRIVDKLPFENGGINLAAIEFEFECAYGYLSGEKGTHYMIRSSQDDPSLLEASSAVVDVIPMSLRTSIDMHIDDEDLIITSLPGPGEQNNQTNQAVCIQHVPTGISIRSAGERSSFANKMKALNRLKAKLHMIVEEQGVSNVSSIKNDDIVSLWQEETRRYVFHPYKLVHDVKTGIQLPDLDYVLDGDIGLLIQAHIHTRIT